MGGEHWPLVGLTFARCAGVLALAPPLNWRPVPITLRLAVAGVLALPVGLGLKGAALPPGDTYLAAVLAEVSVGLVIGLGLWLLTQGLRVGGALGDLWLSGGGDEEGPLAGLWAVLTAVFFVQLNGLQWLVVFLRESYALAPLGLIAPGALATSGSWLLWPGAMLVTALRVAAPLVLASALAGAVAGAADRTLAGGQLGAVLPAVRGGLVLLALVALAPLLGALVLGELDRWAALIVAGLAGLR